MGFLENLRMSQIYQFPQSMREEENLIPRRGVTFNPPQPGMGINPRIQQIAQPPVSMAHQVRGNSSIPAYAQNVNEVLDTNYIPPLNETKEGKQLDILKEQYGTKAQQADRAHQLKIAELGFKKDKQEEDSAIRKQRADVYEFKAKNPNARIVIEKGGRIKAINPITGALIADLGDSGTLSDEDKMILSQQGQQELEGLRQTGRTELQNTRGNQALEQIGARTAGEIQVNAARPTPERLPTQQRIQQYMKATQALNEHPEWRRYLSLGDNDFTIKEPTFGGDGATVDAIYKYIYGTDRNKSTSPGSVVENKTPTSTTKKVETQPINTTDDFIRDPVTKKLIPNPNKKK